VLSTGTSFFFVETGVIGTFKEGFDIGDLPFDFRIDVGFESLEPEFTSFGFNGDLLID
jgi:hypothetical protein